jgi:hypothetical protein
MSRHERVRTTKPHHIISHKAQTQKSVRTDGVLLEGEDHLPRGRLQLLRLPLVLYMIQWECLGGLHVHLFGWLLGCCMDIHEVDQWDYIRRCRSGFGLFA